MTAISTLRNSSALIFAFFVIAMLGTNLHAQSLAAASPLLLAEIDDLPNAPTPQTTPADQQPGGSISGTILDQHGATVPGAHITLELIGALNTPRSTTTNEGGFFYLPSLPPATYKLTITAIGFAPYTASDIVLQPNEIRNLPPISMRIATASTNVEVTVTQQEIAEEQLKLEEKQRVIAIFPNFYVTYNWHAAPLTAKQKFKLAIRSATDPAAFLGAGFAAGFEQWADGYNGYGQGMQGYAKRFGASYTDAFDGTMIGGAILPSLLHQDPRYFYKGTGTIRSRIFYAISTVVICKGDNGRWQPNYSNVLGSLASAGISNLYYPSTDRHGAVLTIRNSLIGTASGAIGALFQEFLIKKISTGVPKTPPPTPAPSSK